MCIFAHSVASVSNTSIAVLADKGERFTAYQMSVNLAETGTGNAMVLPVPANVATIQLIDMSKCKDFFDKLESLWPKPVTLSRGLSPGYLRVQRVGDYEVSIAQNVTDINRLDPDVFRLGLGAEKLLREHYSKLEGWSFVVAKLVAGGSLHPLGYTYTARNPTDLYVPTYHEHGGDSISNHEVQYYQEPLPLWEHNLYFQGPWRLQESPTPADVLDSSEVGVGTLQGVVDRVPQLSKFLNPRRPLRRLKLAGHLPNMDVRLTLHRIQ